MPGPLIRTPRPQLPIMETLPDGLRKVLETVFPPDDIMGPAMPQTAIVGGAARMAIPGLTRALEPLSQGSIDAGIDMAKSFAKDPLDWLPLPPVSRIFNNAPSRPTPEKGRHAVYKMLHEFASNPPEFNPDDALKIFAGERYYRRPAPPTGITRKPGLIELSGDYNHPGLVRVPSGPMKRDPLVEEMYNRYKQFYDFQKSIDAPKISNSVRFQQPGHEAIVGLDSIPHRPKLSPDRKPLSGRWHNKPQNKQVVEQGRALRKDYKKPVK